MSAPNFPAIQQIVVKNFTQNQKCQPQGGAREKKIKGSSKSFRLKVWEQRKSEQTYVRVH